MDSRIVLLSLVALTHCLLVQAGSKSNRTTNYSPAETASLVTAYNNDKSRYGPQVACEDDSKCSQYTGTKCYGLTGCLFCICDPFVYDLSIARNLYHASGKKCLLAKKIGEACEADGQCPLWDRANLDNHVTVTGSARKCTSNKCVCQANYHPLSDKLGCRKPYHGETCAASPGCFSSSTMDCSTTCKCKSTYPIVNSNKMFCRKAYLDEACATTSDCDSSKYLICSNKVCKCTGTTHKKEDSATKGCRKFYVGEGQCTSSTQCWSSVSSTVVCDTTAKICKCSTSTPEKGDTLGKYCRKLKVGENGCKDNPTYTMAFATASNARCYSGGTTTECEGNTCKCSLTHPLKNTNLQSCRKVKADETGCAGSSDSISGGTNNDNACHVSTYMACTSGVCKCTKNADRPVASSTKLSCRRYYVGETGCGTSAGKCGGGSGDATTQCSSNTCKCTTNYPSPSATSAATSCRKSRYNEACTATSQCDSSTFFKCDGSKCVCDPAKYYWARSSAKSGQTGGVACRRADLNSENCNGDRTKCVAQGSVCTNNKCVCESTRVQIGANTDNKCGYIYVWGKTCATGQCFSANLTCASNNTCACKETDNKYDSVLGSCKHNLAKYNEAEKQTCTHSLSGINNYATSWYYKNQNDGSGTSSPVLRCAANLHCFECPSESKRTCKKYLVPINPASSGNSINMAGGLLMMVIASLLL